ncbi:substrate-binding periplasmic protein [Marinobacter alexandrii]|uniref:substrate-binding periplasmic protein n=1 Tax=Marinobacter alexandrii TaxID=2570351 RepID=UPI00110869B0|nr:transporter substrate-binding domain-containing protein [Marinobacter alexandrii]
MTRTTWKFVKYFLAPGLLALVLSATGSADQTRATYRFCEDPWPPYTIGEIGRQPESGIAVELFEELEHRLGMAFELRLLPWKRCLLWAKQGQYDGVMLLTHNDDRATYLHFLTPVHRDANLVWARSDRSFDREFRSFKDFQGLKIGVTDGFTYGEAFNQAVVEHNLTLDSAPSILSNMLRLSLGRIDIFLVNGVAGESALENRPDLRNALTVYRGPFESVPFFIGLSKASPITAYLPLFNEVLTDMTEDGTIERIFGTQSPP